MGDGDRPQSLTVAEAIIPVAALILLIALSYYLFGDAGAAGPNQIALVIAALIAVVIGRRRGHTLASLNEAAAASVHSGIGAIFILFAVGALIGTWALSGTLVAMVYYGLQLLNPDYFYVTVVAICAIVSASIGSSWTVVGTIGIGLMGISANIGMDPAITAAAVISGAYFGDTTSPLSDSANLAAAAAGADLYAHIRETAITSSVAVALALGVFWWLGGPAAAEGTDKAAVIARSFTISPVLILPLVVVVVLALVKVPPFTTIFTGALAGGLLAVIIAPERVAAFAAAEGVPYALALLKGVWQALASGYTSTTGEAALDQLASRGGMASMLTTVWLIMAALAFGGVIEKIGALERLMDRVIRVARSAGALIGAAVGSVVVTNIATADQYIAIVLPGRMFKSAFAGRGLAPVVLSRTIGAAGTPSSALVPWNSCGAYMAATLGVPTFDYLPYAVFNLASPLLAVAMGLIGLRLLRAPEMAEVVASSAAREG